MSAISRKLTRAVKRCSANATSYIRVLQCGGLTQTCRKAAENSDRPNIILITLDSLRADRVGYISNERKLTPTLDALAKESVRFTKAIAQAPWTKPSVGSLLTGLYPSAHGANRRGAFGAQVNDRTDKTRANTMYTGVASLSEILSRAGYTTAAFTGGGFAHAVYQGQGFQHYYNGGHGLHDLFYQAAQWFAGCPPTPFFVWLHAYDTHRPYWGRFPLERFLRRRPFNLTNADVKAINTGQVRLTSAQLKKLIYLYDRGVNYADRQMRLVLQALRASGLLEQSILVFTSDHGEALYEHDLVEHSDVIFNEVLQVPLLIRCPSLPPNTVRQYVRLIDLMPTLLDLVNIPAPRTQGVSLLPAITDERDLHLTALSELEMVGKPYALQTSLQGQDYKIIQWMDTGQTLLFNLTADPGETTNLWEQNSPPKEQLQAALAAQLQENASWTARFETEEPSADKGSEADWEVELRLRDLGYID